MDDYKARVNHSFEFENLSKTELDLVAAGHNKFHILKDGRSFHAEIIAADYSAKQFTIRVNGSDYELALEDHYDQLVKRLGLEINVQHKVKNVKAPMPGLVLEIQVEEEQQVSAGDPILILEAMKMENVIKSTGEGIVKEIMVDKGQAVDKGSVLVTFQA